MKRFSILLPTHNRRETLPLAIESVLRQTISDFELLVVGDGCTDDSAEVVNRFHDSRIRWFDLPKAPYVGYANRNTALREAEGDLIAYACDDDLMLPDHLERLGKKFEDHTTEWVYSRPLWVSTDGIIVPFGTDLTLADEFSEFLRGNTIPSACVMHRRGCFDLYGFWPEEAASAGDWQYWKRIVVPQNGRNIAYVPVPTTLHFSADWRQSRHAGVQFMATLLGLADTAPWWPPVLKAVIGHGQSEQSAIADALRHGGLQWCTSIRAAIDVVTNRNAWDSIKTYLPTTERFEAEVRTLNEQLRQRDGELADLLARHDELVRVREREIAERDGLAHDHRLLVAERDALARDRDGAVAEHDALAHDHRLLIAERDALARDRDGAVAEHDALAHDHRLLVAERDALTRDRDAAVVERDALAHDHRLLVAGRDALARYRDGLVAERDAMLASRSWRLTAPLRWTRKLLAGNR